MGMQRIDSIATALLASLPADTPAAVVQWAGGSNERRLVSRLDRLAADATRAGFGSPAVILVGSAIGESVEHAWAGDNAWRDEAAAMQADMQNAREAIAQAA
jgi:uroporphyrin-III C-methyltransferase